MDITCKLHDYLKQNHIRLTVLRDFYKDDLKDLEIIDSGHTPNTSQYLVKNSDTSFSIVVCDHTEHDSMTEYRYDKEYDYFAIIDSRLKPFFDYMGW